ncbi:SPFH domain-containing protein [Kitasatospora sp. NA04385]|uniref:SPFH domain-containing protein n=1 Tax=Kitasatospora sp. NA04385 TaxID=2742135 RepID=UPI001590753D|nr:SPFH domain-containing protein [Kitasatospora sp. NA04385]QKW20465.1 SPFH domain-containing protein [Kitasatospora sp. NA04385]
MDVTRGPSPRTNSWPPAAPQPPVGATQLTKAVAKAVAKPLITAAPPAEELLDRGPDTQPLPVIGADEPSAFPPGPRAVVESATAEPAGAADRAASSGLRRLAAATARQQAAHPSVADAATHRRPPRADQSLRERRAFVLPGWLPLLVLLAGVAGMLLVLARAGVLTDLPGLPDLRGAAARASGEAEAGDGTLAAVSAIGLVMLGAVGGLLSNPGGETRVLTRWGRYRGTVRRTGLLWVNPLVRRHRVDVRLRHWRSEPVRVTDRAGTPLVVRLLVVWRVKDTARVTLGIAEHETYLREQVQAVLTRTASLLPCDSDSAPGPALRDGQWFADELTRALAAETAPAGIEVYSVQPLALDYAPEVAESMRRRRLADLDAGLRTVLVDDAVEAAALAVRRLERATAHELDDSARSALMEQLLVAFVAPAGVAAPVPAPAVRPNRKEGRPA